MAYTDPAIIVTQSFPAAPYNFDEPPPGTTVGPLHALLSQAGQGIAQFQNNVLLLQAQFSVENAAGPYLDAHGVIYGVQRNVGELDDAYRLRILAALHFGRLTTIAIAAAVLAYYVSKNPTAAYPPIVQCFDNQTDPVDSAAIGLLLCQFVIDIQFPVAASKVFWAGRSFVGRNPASPSGTASGAFAINPNTVITTKTPADPGLVAAVNRNKAGATEPIYRLRRYIVAHA